VRENSYEEASGEVLLLPLPLGMRRSIQSSALPPYDPHPSCRTRVVVSEAPY
jgi:hypothetical protein